MYAAIANQCLLLQFQITAKHSQWKFKTGLYCIILHTLMSHTHSQKPISMKF